VTNARNYQVVDFGRETMLPLQMLNQIMQVPVAQLLFQATDAAQ
jgi:hypothetical protein